MNLYLNYNHINLLYNYCNFLQLAPAKTDVEQKSFDDVVLSCQQVQLITFKKCLDRFANLWPAGTFVTRSLSSVPSPSPSPSPWTSSSPSWVHSATVRSTPPHLYLAFLLSFSILIALHGSVSEKETDRQTDRGEWEGECTESKENPWGQCKHKSLWPMSFGVDFWWMDKNSTWHEWAF